MIRGRHQVSAAWPSYQSQAPRANLGCLLLLSDNLAGSHRAIVRLSVTHEGAGVIACVVGVRDRSGPVWRDYVAIEIDEALTGDGRRGPTHAMRSVTNGAGESGIHVGEMLAPTQVQLGQIVALGAQGIGAGRAQIRVGIQILAGDRLPGHGRLRELVLALENVTVLRSMRPVGTVPARLTAVVVVMAIGAEDL